MKDHAGSTVESRFWSKVVKGPALTDCWIWVGAIADDGYGRWRLKELDRWFVVRPHRYAFEQLHDIVLTHEDILLHSCDVTLCVRADPEHTHLRIGSHAENRAERTQRRERFAGLPQARGLKSIARRAQIANDLRAAVLEHGYDTARIRAIVQGIDPKQPPLF